VVNKTSMFLPKKKDSASADALDRSKEDDSGEDEDVRRHEAPRASPSLPILGHLKEDEASSTRKKGHSLEIAPAGDKKSKSTSLFSSLSLSPRLTGGKKHKAEKDKEERELREKEKEREREKKRKEGTGEARTGG